MSDLHRLLADQNIMESVLYDFPARTSNERLERLVRCLSYQRALRGSPKWWKLHENYTGQRKGK